jgi:NAD(P)H-flavin reductase
VPAGERGHLPDVVAKAGTWRNHDAYLAGPTAMVRATAGRLAATGVPDAQIHTEDFGWSE